MKQLFLIKMVLSISVLLSGCSKKEVNLNTDKRTYYNKAYDHGCSSREGIYKKNIRRYVKNISYREGWNEGYYHCGENRKIKYPFDKKAYRDGYLSAMYQKPIIKYRNESYRTSWKKGYYYYMKKN